MGYFEDGGFRVGVDGDDEVRILHPHLVLQRAGNARRDVELGAYRLARLPDLVGVADPSGIDAGTARADDAAQFVRQFLQQLEALRPAEAASTP